MKLNTNDIVGVNNEDLKSTGLTFHRIETQWGDVTKDRSLYGYEVDRNFFNLKAQDIREAYFSGNTITLMRWNGEPVNIVIKNLTDLAEELEDLTKTTDSFSAATEDALSKLSTALKNMSGEVATQDWVIEQGYLTEEKAEDLYVLKEAIETIIFEWAEDNLKSVNCHSLIGCGNVAIDCCGGGGSGSSITIEAGSAITVTTKDGEVRISVKVGEVPLESVESGYYSGKNFLHYDSAQNALVVNGVDSDAVYISQDIKLGGTPFADMAIEAGLFKDNTIPAGMTLQEVLNKIFSAESWGNPGVEYYFSATTDNPNIFVSGNTEIVRPGQVMYFSASTSTSTGFQRAIATGFTAGGYELNGEIVKSPVYTLNINPSEIMPAGIVCMFSGFTEYDEETGEYVPATPTSGELKTVYTSNGENVFAVCWSGITYAPNVNWDDVVLHDVSSIGNISSADTIISKDGFSGYTEIMITGKTIFTYTCSLNNYFAFHAIKNSYSGTPVENGEFIVNELRPYDKDLRLNVQCPEEGEPGINGTKQITIAVPMSFANHITLFKKGLDGVYAEIKTNIFRSTALIEETEYNVLAYMPGKTYSTESYKVLLTNE